MSDITAGKEGPVSKRWVLTETRQIVVESPFDLSASNAMVVGFNPKELQPIRAYIVDDHTTRNAYPTEE